MQKAFSLQPSEQQQAAQLENEHRALLAQYGQITLQGEQIKQRLPAIEEQQRGLVRTVVQRLGITQFNAARVDGTNVIVDVPDEVLPAAAVAHVESVPAPVRINGATATE